VAVRAVWKSLKESTKQSGLPRSAPTRSCMFSQEQIWTSTSHSEVLDSAADEETASRKWRWLGRDRNVRSAAEKQRASGTTSRAEKQAKSALNAALKLAGLRKHEDFPRGFGKL
jgi:hypothetical protein